jgi:hypothetical protein
MGDTRTLIIKSAEAAAATFHFAGICADLMGNVSRRPKAYSAESV